MTGRSMRVRRRGLVLATVLCWMPGIVSAADLTDSTVPFDGGYASPRYFPRGDGSESGIVMHPIRRRTVACVPRQVPVPTNASDDPSYVGSEYGLSKPSYYGFTPPRGVDDPFGRPLLPYCR